MAKDIVDAKRDTGKAPSQKIKDIRDLFQVVIDSQESACLPTSQINLAEGILRYIDSKITDKQILNIIARSCRP